MEIHMTKIAISTYDAAALAAARRAGESRQYIWQRIKNQFGIPSHLKLGMATDRTLYVKGSEPREFLFAGAGGQVAYSQSAATATRDAQVPATITTTAPRFAVEPSSIVSWVKVGRGQLVQLAEDLGEAAHVIPEGFPAAGSGLVFDTQTGDLYFR
jgi:hypothetical protein